MVLPVSTDTADRTTGRPLNLADVIEAMADAVPERIAVATMDRDYTYAEVDERSTRLANHLVSLGVRPGDHVAVHSANRIEWVDALYACFKARAVPINVNYKYLHEELAYLYDNADCVATIVAPEHVAAVEELDLPMLKHVLVLGEEYDAALAAASTERLTGRSADDHYVLYTGGTTGNPKGVVWRQDDLIMAALNAARFGAPIESVEKLAEEAAAVETPMVMLACGPMMHGGSQWILGNAHVAGATVALFDRAELLRGGDPRPRAGEGGQLADVPRRRDGPTGGRRDPGRAGPLGPLLPGRRLQRRRPALRRRPRPDPRGAARPLHPRHLRRLGVRGHRVPDRRRHRRPDRRPQVRGRRRRGGVRPGHEALPHGRRRDARTRAARSRSATTTTRSRPRPPSRRSTASAGRSPATSPGATRTGRSPSSAEGP